MTIRCRTCTEKCDSNQLDTGGAYREACERMARKAGYDERKEQVSYYEQ